MQTSMYARIYCIASPSRQVLNYNVAIFNRMNLRVFFHASNIQRRQFLLIVTECRYWELVTFVTEKEQPSATKTEIISADNSAILCAASG